VFLETYTGRMSGVLRWPQLDKLWRNLDANDGWYLYEPGNEIPASPINRDDLQIAIGQMDAFLHQEHNAEYCGVVYTDELDDPSLLKIYHPKKMGASCGSSGSTVLPKWTLSRHPPVDLVEWALQKDHKPFWWKHMLRPRS
jgi:hypothetical protein